MLNRTQNENDLAKAMLGEIVTNSTIKNSLQTIATQAIESILKPFLKIILEQEAKSFDGYPSLLQKAINYLADKHIRSEAQFGALMAELQSKEEITHSRQTTINLFARIENCLSHITSLSTIEELLSVLKCLADLGWCYFECLPDLHQSTYDTIKNMVWLTPEEFFDARIRQDETDQAPLSAYTFGISKQIGKDLIPAKLGIGWEAGKSIFAGVSMQQRFEILTQRFDKKLKEVNEAIAERDKDPSEIFTKHDEYIKKLEAELDPLRLKMQYYQIPADINARKPIAYYALQYQTTFEKLAKLPLAKHEQAMPLIASVSGSTARTVIALQDISAFQEKGKYDFDKLQILNNCLAAFYIYCGHHSWLEVAEVHNRLLDYIAIYDRGGLSSIDDTKNDLPYMHNPSKLEAKLPYYQIGDYKSFLHESFAAQLIVAAYAKPSASFKL